MCNGNRRTVDNNWFFFRRPLTRINPKLTCLITYGWQKEKLMARAIDWWIFQRYLPETSYQK